MNLHIELVATYRVAFFKAYPANMYQHACATTPHSLKRARPVATHGRRAWAVSWARHCSKALLLNGMQKDSPSSSRCEEIAFRKNGEAFDIMCYTLIHDRSSKTSEIESGRVPGGFSWLRDSPWVRTAKHKNTKTRLVFKQNNAKHPYRRHF